MYMNIPNCYPPLEPRAMNSTNSFYQMVSINSLEETHQCSICLNPFEKTCKQKRYVKRLRCGHVFHSVCIDKWIDMKGTCPYCRNVLLSRNIIPKKNDDEAISNVSDVYEDFFDDDMPLAQRRRILLLLQGPR
jgi:uncharacterized CHY-type Zn-finger protein